MTPVPATRSARLLGCARTRVDRLVLIQDPRWGPPVEGNCAGAALIRQPPVNALKRRGTRPRSRPLKPYIADLSLSAHLPRDLSRGTRNVRLCGVLTVALQRAVALAFFRSGHAPSASRQAIERWSATTRWLSGVDVYARKQMMNCSKAIWAIVEEALGVSRSAAAVVCSSQSCQRGLRVRDRALGRIGVRLIGRSYSGTVPSRCRLKLQRHRLGALAMAARSTAIAMTGRYRRHR